MYFTKRICKGFDTSNTIKKHSATLIFKFFFFDLVNEKQEFTCKNKKEGTYKSPSKCNKYYICTGNSDMAILRTCPKHTNFHPETKACVFTFSYSCEGKCALL